MLKPILRILAFCAVIFALNIGANVLFEPIEGNSELSRSLSDRIEHIGHNGDVIFMGDSRTHQGLSPRTFEAAVRESTGEQLTAVNLGRPGMQTPFFYYALQNYLNTTEKKPKVLIMNVSYYLLHGRDWMDKIYFLGFTPTWDQTVDSVRSGLQNPWQAFMWNLRTRTPLLQYRWPFKSVFMNLWASPVSEIKEGLNFHHRVEATLYDGETGGFLSRGPSHIGPTTKQIGPIFNPGLADPLHLRYLQRVMQMARENDIEIIIYEYPWPEYQKSDHDVATIAHYTEIITKIAAPFENVHLVEHAHFWEHTFFVDPLHVNDSGADRLSKLAAKWYMELPAK